MSVRTFFDASSPPHSSFTGAPATFSVAENYRSLHQPTNVPFGLPNLPNSTTVVHNPIAVPAPSALVTQSWLVANNNNHVLPEQPSWLAAHAPRHDTVSSSVSATEPLKTVLVKRNDSLIKLAKLHSVEPSHLAAFNGLDVNNLNFIREGSTLAIPTPEAMLQPEFAARITEYEQGLVKANAQYLKQRAARLEQQKRNQVQSERQQRLEANEASSNPFPSLTKVSEDFQHHQKSAKDKREAQIPALLAAAEESKNNAPSLTASEFSVFRDTRVGRKIATFFQTLSGSNIDGVPYSFLGDYFPSKPDIQDSKFTVTALTAGQFLPLRIGAMKLMQPALDKVSEARVALEHAVQAAKTATRSNNAAPALLSKTSPTLAKRNLDTAWAQYEKAAITQNGAARKTGALYLNVAAVSSAYGVGSTYLAGDTPTFQTALGSAATGLFLVSTGPAIVNATAKAGLSGGLPFAAHVAYRSGVWGGYGLLATGDPLTAATMAAGGGLLTWAGTPVKAALSADTGAATTLWNVYKADVPYLLPGMGLTGWAKSQDNPPKEPGSE